MNWREWPQGAESIDAPGDRDICPVCSSTLRPMKAHCTLTAYTIYTAICPKCRTQYLRDAPIGTVTISPDAEAVTELEERVRTLEETLSRLIAWIRTQHTQPQQLHAPQKQESPKDDAEEFTRKYRYLL